MTNLLQRLKRRRVPVGLITFPRKTVVTTRQQLRNQLVDDIVRLGGLIHRVSRGDRSIKTECDELRGAVQIKQALLAGVRRRGPWT